MEKGAPSAIERFCETTSRESPSQQSDVWLAAVVSSVFPGLFTKRPAESSKSSWKTLSVML